MKFGNKYIEREIRKMGSVQVKRPIKIEIVMEEIQKLKEVLDEIGSIETHSDLDITVKIRVQ